MARNRADPRGQAQRRRAGTEWLHGLNVVREALASRRRQLLQLRLREGTSSAEVGVVVRRAESLGIPIESVSAGRLAASASDDVNPQGVALLVGPLPELSLEELASGARAPSTTATLVALDGVEDPQNVGAIARVAEAAGAAGLLLTRRRAPPLTAAVARASAGAIEWLPVARVGNLTRALEELKEQGFWVFGASPTAAVDLYELPVRVARGDRVVVLGAEGRGIRPGVERVLDHAVRIPMEGRVGSLNVSAAAAVLLFELQRRERVADARGIPYK